MKRFFSLMILLNMMVLRVLSNSVELTETTKTLDEVMAQLHTYIQDRNPQAQELFKQHFASTFDSKHNVLCVEKQDIDVLDKELLALKIEAIKQDADLAFDKKHHSTILVKKGIYFLGSQVTGLVLTGVGGALQWGFAYGSQVIEDDAVRSIARVGVEGARKMSIFGGDVMKNGKQDLTRTYETICNKEVAAKIRSNKEFFENIVVKAKELLQQEQLAQQSVIEQVQSAAIQENLGAVNQTVSEQ